MTSIKGSGFFFITGTLLSSCTTIFEDSNYEYQPTLEEVVSGYDLWYIDYNRTTGNGDIPFISRAFTLSFINGILYANNNIVDIGRTGNGLGMVCFQLILLKVLMLHWMVILIIKQMIGILI